jgi:Acyl-CoA carboxylase epsilon subunit
MSSADEPRRPALRVIRGDATEEEIAALLAVLVARTVASAGLAASSAAGLSGAPGGSDASGGSTSAWSDRSAGLRRPLSAGPGAWRASAWQR